jgi:Mrp family chromosome partitioning ATPase/capsular polysaccharide biosynthesis protein
MTRDQDTPLAVERGVIAFHLRALTARRRVLFLVTAAALVVGILWVAQRPPSYKASAQILLSPLPQADSSLFGVSLLREATGSGRTLDTAVTLLDTPSAAARAAREMGNGWTRARMAEAVSVKLRPAANIIDVSAEASSPGEAARVANTFARAALGQRRDLVSQQASVALRRAEAQLESIGRLNPDDAAALLARVNKLEDVADGTDPTMTLSELATPPDHPSGVPALLVVIAAGIGGLALGAGAILLFELLDRRVRDEEGILETYPLPVLTRIPNMSRQQRSALSGPEPVLAHSARERFRMIAPQLARKPKLGRAILVTSPSAGDGKTTAALGLALSLAGAEHRVLLVDLDLRSAELSARLGVRLEQGVERLLHPDSELTELAVEVPGSPGLSILPGEPTRDVALIEAMLRRLVELIEGATVDTDYVVIDAPALGDVGDSLWLAEHVYDVILVVRPGSTFRAHLAIAHDMLERAGILPDGMIVMGGPGTGVSDYGSGGYGLSREAAAPLRRLARLGR